MFPEFLDQPLAKSAVERTAPGGTDARHLSRPPKSAAVGLAGNKVKGRKWQGVQVLHPGAPGNLAGGVSLPKNLALDLVSLPLALNLIQEPGKRHLSVSQYQGVKLGMGQGLLRKEHGVRAAETDMRLREDLPHQLGGFQDVVKGIGKGGDPHHLWSELAKMEAQALKIQPLGNTVQHPYFVSSFPPHISCQTDETIGRKKPDIADLQIPSGGDAGEV